MLIIEVNAVQGKPLLGSRAVPDDRLRKGGGHSDRPAPRARHVVGVDLNPEMIALLQERYSDFAGEVYQGDEVELVVSEGGYFLSRDLQD